jgi:ribosomal-protein-alanine N-acetyltransferase
MIERESFSDAWSENMFHDLFGSPLIHGFVAENGGEILGYVLFYNLEPELQILNIAVRKSARNQKIGSLLLESVLACENITWVTLEVRASNTPAIKLYSKFGFKIDGFRKNYYNKPKENAILMSLTR